MSRVTLLVEIFLVMRFNSFPRIGYFEQFIPMNRFKKNKTTDHDVLNV